MGYQLPVPPREPNIVHEFENGHQWIRATVSTFRAKVYADIRVWYEPEPGSPMRPTQKGIAIFPENLDELEAAVAALKAELNRPGQRPKHSEATVRSGGGQ